MARAVINYEIPQFKQIVSVTANDAGADILALDEFGSVWVGMWSFNNSAIEWEAPKQYVVWSEEDNNA